MLLTIFATLTQTAISGIVVDSASAEPLGEALVSLLPGPRTTVSLPDGRFDLGVVPPGQYRFRIDKLGYESRAFTVTVARNTGPAVRLDPVQLQASPPRVAVIHGVVVRGSSRIAGSVVEINSQEIGVSDHEGVFEGTASVFPGLNVVTVRTIGFDVVTDSVWYTANDSILTLAVSLDQSPFMLPDLRVEGVEDGKLSMFHRHRRAEQGTFLFGAALEAARRFTVTDLLGGVAGVRVDPGTNRIRLSRAGLPCRGAEPLYFIDGVVVQLARDETINHLLDQYAVIAVEVYNGPARVPVVYNRAGAVCGVIVLWTR